MEESFANRALPTSLDYDPGEAWKAARDVGAWAIFAADGALMDASERGRRMLAGAGPGAPTLQAAQRLERAGRIRLALSPFRSRGATLTICALEEPEAGGRNTFSLPETQLSLFDQAPVAVAILQGARHRYRYANPYYLRMAGRDDIVGKDYLEAFPELAGTPIVGVLDDVLRTGKPFSADELFIPFDDNQDGVLEDHYFRFSLEPLRDAQETVQGIIAIAVDITSQAEARRKVALDERQLRNLVNTMPALAWTARADGWIDFYNERWYEYTGTAPAQMEGWGWQSVHDPSLLPEVLARWQESIRTGKPFEMSFPLRGADGRFRWFLTRVQPIVDDEGKVVRWFGTNTDVDEQVRSAQHLSMTLEGERNAREQAERMLVFSEMFAGILAHDLRNPLSATLTSAQLLVRMTQDERLLKPVQRIVASSERMSKMIDQLLDFTRIRLGGGLKLSPRPVDLADVVRHVTTELEAQKFRVTSSGDLKGSWDGDRLYQLLSNLAGNAVKHGTPPVDIHMDGTDGARVRVTVRNGGEIPLEKRNSMFDPFQQAATRGKHSQGLGLGLYISQQVAQAHGGEVHVASGDGTTTFTLELPRNAPAGQIAPETP